MLVQDVKILGKFPSHAHTHTHMSSSLPKEALRPLHLCVQQAWDRWAGQILAVSTLCSHEMKVPVLGRKARMADVRMTRCKCSGALSPADLGALLGDEAVCF